MVSTGDFGKEGEHTRLRINRQQPATRQNDDKEFYTLPEEKRISPATFCRAFPFHVIFDKDLIVVQAGKSPFY